MPPVTKMRVGATEKSRQHHPKTAPQAARSSKRCIIRASQTATPELAKSSSAFNLFQSSRAVNPTVGRSSQI
jgi:hypothetical protein